VRPSARGLDGPAACLHCDQEAETIDHLLVQCPTSRAIWHRLLTEAGLGGFVPQPDSRLRPWWSGLASCQPRKWRTELLTLCVAGCLRL
jgi:hypothetical protein